MSRQSSRLDFGPSRADQKPITGVRKAVGDAQRKALLYLSSQPGGYFPGYGLASHNGCRIQEHLAAGVQTGRLCRNTAKTEAPYRKAAVNRLTQRGCAALAAQAALMESALDSDGTLRFAALAPGQHRAHRQQDRENYGDRKRLEHAGLLLPPEVNHS